jgi:hypothetical protein
MIVVDHGALRQHPAGHGAHAGYYYHYLERTRARRSRTLPDDDATLTAIASRSGIRVGTATPSLASVLRVRPAIVDAVAEDEGPPGRRRAVLSSGSGRASARSRSAARSRSGRVASDRRHVCVVCASGWSHRRVERCRSRTRIRHLLYNGVAPRWRHVRTHSELNRLIPDVTKSFPGDHSPRATPPTSARLDVEQPEEASSAMSRVVDRARPRSAWCCRSANVANCFRYGEGASARSASLALCAARNGMAFRGAAWLSAQAAARADPGMVQQLLVSNGRRRRHG